MTPEACGFDWGSVSSVMFVCHGNICRSPMAQCVLAEYLQQAGIDGISVLSSATSTEEIGNGIHYGALAEMRRRNIPVIPHYAIQLRRSDVFQADVFLGMDGANVRNMLRMLGDEAGGRCFRLLDFSSHPRDIADPWYTGDFTETWFDIDEGCRTIVRLMAETRSKLI